MSKKHVHSAAAEYNKSRLHSQQHGNLLDVVVVGLNSALFSGTRIDLFFSYAPPHFSQPQVARAQA